MQCVNHQNLIQDQICLNDECFKAFCKECIQFHHKQNHSQEEMMTETLGGLQKYCKESLDIHTQSIQYEMERLQENESHQGQLFQKSQELQFIKQKITKICKNFFQQLQNQYEDIMQNYQNQVEQKMLYFKKQLDQKLQETQKIQNNLFQKDKCAKVISYVLQNRELMKTEMSLFQQQYFEELQECVPPTEIVHFQQNIFENLETLLKNSINVGLDQYMPNISLNINDQRLTGKFGNQKSQYQQQNNQDQNQDLETISQKLSQIQKPQKHLENLQKSQNIQNQNKQQQFQNLNKIIDQDDDDDEEDEQIIKQLNKLEIQKQDTFGNDQYYLQQQKQQQKQQQQQIQQSNQQKQQNTNQFNIKDIINQQNKTLISESDTSMIHPNEQPPILSLTPRTHVEAQKNYDILKPSYFKKCQPFLHYFADKSFLGYTDPALYIYDLATPEGQRKWNKLKIQNKFQIPLLHKSVVTPKGDIYLLGGQVKQKPQTGIYKFDFNTYQILKQSGEIQPRLRFSSIFSDNYIYTVGGEENEKGIKTCEVYDIKNDKVIRIKDLNYPAYDSSLVQVDNFYVYKIGGLSFSNCLSGYIERFNPKIQEWQVFQIDLTTQNGVLKLLAFPGCVQINNNHILCFGGMDQKKKSSKQAFLIEIGENHCKLGNYGINNMPQSCSFQNGNCFIQDKQVYVLGRKKKVGYNPDPIIKFSNFNWEVLTV